MLESLTLSVSHTAKAEGSDTGMQSGWTGPPESQKGCLEERNRKFMLGFAPHLLVSCLLRIPFWSLTLPEVLRHLSQFSWFHQAPGMVVILLKKVGLKPYSSHQRVGQMAYLAAQAHYPFLYLIFPTWNRSTQGTNLGLWIPVGSGHLILQHWPLRYLHHFMALAVTGENLST